MKSCFAPFPFIKERWMGLRDMDVAVKYVGEESYKPDAWKYARRSDKLIKKYGVTSFLRPHWMTGSFPL